MHMLGCNWFLLGRGLICAFSSEQGRATFLSVQFPDSRPLQRSQSHISFNHIKWLHGLQRVRPQTDSTAPRCFLSVGFTLGNAAAPTHHHSAHVSLWTLSQLRHHFHHFVLQSRRDRAPMWLTATTLRGLCDLLLGSQVQKTCTSWRVEKVWVVHFSFLDKNYSVN